MRVWSTDLPWEASQGATGPCERYGWGFAGKKTRAFGAVLDDNTGFGVPVRKEPAIK